MRNLLTISLHRDYGEVVMKKSCIDCFNFRMQKGTSFARCVKHPEVYRLIGKKILDKRSTGAKELEGIAEKREDSEDEQSE